MDALNHSPISSSFFDELWSEATPDNFLSNTLMTATGVNTRAPSHRHYVNPEEQHLSTLATANTPSDTGSSPSPQTTPTNASSSAQVGKKRYNLPYTSACSFEHIHARFAHSSLTCASCTRLVPRRLVAVHSFYRTSRQETVRTSEKKRRDRLKDKMKALRDVLPLGEVLPDTQSYTRTTTHHTRKHAHTYHTTAFPHTCT